MRSLGILAALAALPGVALEARQDAPGRTATEDVTYAFTMEQGWKFIADGERELFAASEKDLTKGLSPLLVQPSSDNGFNQPLRPTTPGRPRASLPPSSASTFGRTQKDPFKVEGSVILRVDGSATLSFKKIEYWDGSQRWWIDFEDQKIRTLELGGTSKWSGTRQEWAARLDHLDTAFIETYLKAVSPQKREEHAGKIGLAPPAQDSGRR